MGNETVPVIDWGIFISDLSSGDIIYESTISEISRSTWAIREPLGILGVKTATHMNAAHVRIETSSEN